jgi:hypothetical protein
MKMIRITNNTPNKKYGQGNEFATLKYPTQLPEIAHRKLTECFCILLGFVRPLAQRAIREDVASKLGVKVTILSNVSFIDGAIPTIVDNVSYRGAMLKIEPLFKLVAANL